MLQMIVLRLGKRQANRKRATLAFDALNRYLAAVQLDDFLDHKQADAHTADIASAHIPCSVKWTVAETQRCGNGTPC
jgi:hypothetical protein